MRAEDGVQSVQTVVSIRQALGFWENKCQGYLCTGQSIVVNVTDVPVFTPEHKRPDESWLCSRVPKMLQGLKAIPQMPPWELLPKSKASHIGKSHHILIAFLTRFTSHDVYQTSKQVLDVCKSDVTLKNEDPSALRIFKNKTKKLLQVPVKSVSCSVMSNSLRPHGL